MNEKVHVLPGAPTYTVEQALHSALQQTGLKCVVIVGEYDNGDLFVRSSRMTREEANWLYDRGKLYALGIANMKGGR